MNNLTQPNDPAERALDIVRQLSAGTLRRDPERGRYQPPAPLPVPRTPLLDLPDLTSTDTGYQKHDALRRAAIYLLHRGEVTPVALAARCAASPCSARKVLEELRGEGRARRTGNGVVGSPFTFIATV